MQNAEKYYSSLTGKYDDATAEGWNAPNFVEHIPMSLTNKMQGPA